ncbi:unnamed protein product [Parnassius apollo]|uniref:(apollo) hypothetical protein n=1 Tax=Parnassius apollo TaxID=110799 RepID=A0A8S3X1L2_PARAO|nr:unnamed protein product [Parnassius apollo]
MVYAKENAERCNISSQRQWIEPIGKHSVVDDSSRSALDAVEWKELVLGSPSPEMGSVFHVRPNPRLAKLQAVCRHEILSHSAEHAKLLRGQFGHLFQVTTKLHIT